MAAKRLPDQDPGAYPCEAKRAKQITPRQTHQRCRGRSVQGSVSGSVPALFKPKQGSEDLCEAEQGDTRRQLEGTEHTRRHAGNIRGGTEARQAGRGHSLKKSLQNDFGLRPGQQSLPRRRAHN